MNFLLFSLLLMISNWRFVFLDLNSFPNKILEYMVLEEKPHIQQSNMENPYLCSVMVCLLVILSYRSPSLGRRLIPRYSIIILRAICSDVYKCEYVVSVTNSHKDNAECFFIIKKNSSWFFGAWIVKCFPSIAPQQLERFHCL